MDASDDPMAGCRHDRAPLKRLGKITHERSGQRVYVLLCTACGFTVTTDELRRMRSGCEAGAGGAMRRAPRWAPGMRFDPAC